ncbi:MAG TPA: F0F1 ATP synthase subunit delta [bacterium]|nr:F0F1 ATP synthase subunit delta [bacterium]HPV65645.1 F0F1 ATP synthase subunit delta [bacterium]
MKIKAKQYAQALFLEARGKEGKELSNVIDKFFEVLKTDNNISQIGKIIFYFNELWNKENSLVEAEITCSRSLESNLKNDVLSYLKKISKAENIKISEKENKKIIGGFVLKYGDKIIDASIKNKINSFKNSLLN